VIPLNFGKAEKTDYTIGFYSIGIKTIIGVTRG